MKISTKICFVFLVLYLLHPSLIAENYKFGNITTKDGLSDNQINCIYKDTRGFMWFGNRNGLNRYDGFRIKVFQHDKNNQNSIPNNYIVSIQETFDKKLWITTYNGISILDPLTEKFSNDVTKERKNLGVTEVINNTFTDSRKNIWFLNPKHLFRYDYKTESLMTHKSNGNWVLKDGGIYSILDRGNKVWFLYRNGIVEERDYKSLRLLYRYTQAYDYYKSQKGISIRLFVDSETNVWVYSLGKGVMCYNRKSNKWILFNTTSSTHRLTCDIVNEINESKDGKIWMATDKAGVNIYNKKNQQISYVVTSPDFDNSLSFNSIQNIFVDDFGIIWLGTYKQGVNYYHPNIFKFESERASDKNAYSLPFNDINVFLEDKAGNLWMGSNGYGLAVRDKRTNQYKRFTHDPRNPRSLSSDVIVSLKNDNLGRLWIGTYMGGLSCFNGTSFVNYSPNPKDKNAVSNNSVWDLAFDKKGNLWVAYLGGGVDGFDKNMKKIAHLQLGDGHLKSDYVMSLTMDYPTLIIGTAGGVNTYNVEQLSYVDFFDFKLGETEVVNSHINLVIKDTRGLYWIGTLAGLNCYNPKTKEIVLFTEKDGLPDNVIQAAVEDENNDIWVSTVKGICRFQVKKNGNSYGADLTTYNEKDGISNTSLNYKASIRTSDNRIYFGGTNGINYFRVQNLNDVIHEAEIVFTDFQIYNQSIQAGVEYDGREVLEKSITESSKITLRHSQNYFSIGFASLNYFLPRVTHYIYKLDGVNSQWIKTNENSQQASFTNLSPGTYTLLVKAVYKSGQTSKNTGSIIIEVLPPWWLSGWAYFIYFVLLGLLFYYMYKQFMNRITINRHKLETEKERKLDEMKLQFFTNISHEFRTPLTLILTPLETLINQTFDTQIRSQLEMMRRNANQLLQLVNQVLDFRKLEVTGQELTLSKGDVVEFLNELFCSFNDSFEKKRINAIFSSPVKSLWVNFDVDKLQKVVSNILSNALKFTPENGEIKLLILIDIQKESKKVVIRIDIADTGIGIPEEHVSKVFDSFYQVPASNNSVQGSGIGLHLVKKYVELMGGVIDLKSVVDEGSTFSITIPLELIDSLHLVSDHVEKKNNPYIDKTKVNSSLLPLALIVEDNEDLRGLLKAGLSDMYQIAEAPNGEIGLEMVSNLLPDLIITDLMMPEMDGLEMSRAIKSDVCISHIPIIILTAKKSDEIEKSSLEIGVEDFITKPFNMESLLLKVRNIKARQQSIQKDFQEKMTIDTVDVQYSSLDEQLIQRAVKIVDQNLKNGQFSVEELSKQLGMSRVNLYKKMLAITGKSPIEFIRFIRLKRGAKLLEKSQLSVAEVGYEVGFNTPRYFSKYFREEFKVNPTVFRERLGMKTDSFEKWELDEE